MRIVEEKIYQFEELEDEAKERAREWWRDVADYPFHDENIKSIKEFCAHFGVTLKDWSIGGRGEYLKTDAEGSHFRGYTLAKAKQLNDKGYFPESGMWLDCTMIQSFYEDFKKTGDALYAFQQALETALHAINSDIEYQYSDEAVDEMLIINEYEFTETGKRY
jgi:hypothetical protein